jgi:hypothetical protein
LQGLVATDTGAFKSHPHLEKLDRFLTCPAFPVVPKNLTGLVEIRHDQRGQDDQGLLLARPPASHQMQRLAMVRKVHATKDNVLGAYMETTVLMEPFRIVLENQSAALGRDDGPVSTLTNDKMVMKRKPHFVLLQAIETAICHQIPWP